MIHIPVGEQTLAAVEHNSTAEGTPIIYMHGILNSVYIQESILAEVLADRHWYALSLPGHYPAVLGANFVPDDLTPDFMAETMSAAVRELAGGGPVRLLGHSTGGYAALAIAHTAPELLESVCLVDAFATGRWGSLALRPSQILANVPGVGRALFGAYMRMARGNRLFVSMFHRFITPNARNLRQNPAFVTSIDLAARDSAHLDIPSLFAYFRNMPHTSIMDWLPGIDVPVTILHGDCDPVIPPRHAQEMANALPHADLRWFAGAGHSPFLEQPARFAEEVRAWAAS